VARVVQVESAALVELVELVAPVAQEVLAESVEWAVPDGRVELVGPVESESQAV